MCDYQKTDELRSGFCIAAVEIQLPEILLVNTDEAVASSLAAALAERGYRVSVVTTFQEARQVLATRAIDLLIADVQLAEYNGLHLAAYAQAFTRLPVIVTHHASDPFFQREAMKLGAVFVPKPTENRVHLLDMVHQLCPPQGVPYRGNRLWPRRRIDVPVTALAASKLAHIADVSYTGVKLVFDDVANLPQSFDIEVPEADLRVGVKRIWATGEYPYVCGAAIHDESRDRWCSFVDSIQ